MKAVWYEKPGPADKVLQFGEMPDPDPGPGEVLVKLHTSGVNPIDVKVRMGARGDMAAPRIIPHFDGAGMIEAVGSGVQESRIGERVWIYGAQWEREFGTAAERIALPEKQAVPLPEKASFDDGACLGIPTLTAYGAVFSDGSVKGKTVMVTGGAGAVSRYAVQFAKLGGAETITTVSSDEKAEIAKSAGASHVLNYMRQDVAAEVTEITQGNGIDLIVEVEFGGNLPTSIACLKTGGTIASYASQAVPEPTLPFYTLMYKAIVLRHVLVFRLSDSVIEQAITDINRWMESGELTHHVGPRFPLSETVAAHQAVEAGAVGKVLVDV